MISVCEPLIGERELQYVIDCIKTNWISSKGRYIEEFEQKFASYCGCKYGVATTSGTTALHLALVSLGISKGDEVIVPTFTMTASVLPIIYTGAKPVLVDSEPETWNLDVTRLEEKITRSTKAIMPVHIYGHPCNMDPIVDIASKYKELYGTNPSPRESYQRTLDRQMFIECQRRGLEPRIPPRIYADHLPEAMASTLIQRRRQFIDRAGSVNE